MPGMDLETAKSAMDWLKSIGCRAIPLMGGEPLLRKDFVLEVIRYGAENGFFMYLPTNGYLLDKAFIDEVGRAGVAAINLAVDYLSFYVLPRIAVRFYDILTFEYKFDRMHIAIELVGKP